MPKAVLPFFFLLSGCGFFFRPLNIWVSDEAWLDAALEWTEETGRETNVRFSPANTDPSLLEPRPDVLLGPGWLLFSHSAKDLRGVLSRTHLMPDAFLPGLYPSGEWIHPVKALPVGLVVPMVITREAPDLPPTAEFQTLLAPFQVRRGGMGFSPWWNRDLAVSLFAMGGGDAAAWRQWSQENNGGNDLAFQSGLLNLIPLQEIRENRLGAWVIPATRLPLLTRQELEGLAIRPVTVEGRVPLLPRTHWAVIPQGSGAGAEDFLSWLLDRDRLAGILADSASPSMTALAAPLRSETMPLPEFLGISGETPLYLPPEGPEAEDVDALFREELDWDAFRAKFVLTE